MKKYLLVLLGLFWFVIVCKKFSPNETNFVEIEDPKTTLSVNLDSPPDTLYSFSQLELNYTIDLRDGEFSFVRILINGQEIEKVYNDSTYTLNTTEIKEGLHMFKLEVWAKTRSGSAADFFNQEFKLAEIRELPLRVVNSIPSSAPKIKTVEIENGRLKITWDRFMAINFRNYELTIGVPPDLSKGYIRVNIYDWNVKSYIDSNYVGGPIQCRIEAVGKNYAKLSEAYIYNGPASEWRGVQVTEDNKAKLEWTKCPVDSNFKYYKVVRMPFDYLYLENLNYAPGALAYIDTLATITDINNTKYVDDDFGFGSMVYFIFTGPGINKNPVKIKNRELRLGTKIPSFDFIKFIPSMNTFLLRKVEYNNISYLVDASSFVTLKQFSNALDISADGQFAIKIDVNNDRKIYYEIDPQTFAEIDTYNLHEIVSIVAFGTANFVLSNNRHLFYESKWNNTPDGLDVLDLDAKKAIGSLTVPGSVFNIEQVTENGRYVIGFQARDRDHHHIYEFTKPNFEHLLAVDSRLHRTRACCFNYGGNSLITTNNNAIQILELPSLSVLKSFPIPDDLMQPIVDPITHYLGGFTTDRKYRIYDLDTGTLEKEFNIIPDESTGYYLMNSTIVSSEGICLKLDL